ncbi:LacI family DNA-binding transcriptional regulator [Aestuariivivens sediminis]|uniref:LacI family DNA-binding transcriptional regulator n=1 Tax=Aestuariivivens sediminis TaxID=2913557 RepID=UPI001F5800C9|nr:LacI family DNA-binding transcriptional regulator [Aestuariivivens sediminis]
MKINQQYIADILNVSRVTVTKALQDHPDISNDTKKKIKELADQLGYIPSGIGRSLSTKKTDTLGIIVPKINHSFFSSVIEELYRKAAELNYQIILMVSFEDEEIEFQNVKTLLSMNVDGILIDSASSSVSDRAFSLIEKHRKPLLYFDRKQRNIDNSGIFFEDYKLSYDLTSEIIKRGYKKIMYLSGPQHINISYDRLNGFKDAMNNSNLSIPNGWIIKTDLDKKNAMESFLLFLQTHNELPEAVICVNDSVALGVYEACYKKGIKIPDDIGVMGFGHVRISNLVQPPLSTVQLDIKSASTIAIEKLVQLIKSSNELIEDQIVGGTIIFRESITRK